MRAGRLGGMGLAAFLLLASASRGQDSLNVTRIGQISLSLSAAACVLEGDLLYVADEYTGLRIFNVGAGTSLSPIGEWQVANGAHGIELSGSYAFLTSWSYGLHVLDVSNPAVPEEVGSLALANAVAIEISGNYAYITGGDQGMYIVDISNPSAPQLAATYVSAFSLWDIAIQDSLAFVSNGDAGMGILNLVNPESPLEIGRYDSCSASGLDVQGSLVYTVGTYYPFSRANFVILNVSNPAQPTPVGGDTVSGFDVSVSGNLACISAGMDGAFFEDISNPASPVVLSNYAIGGMFPFIPSCNGAAFVDNLCYLMYGYAGIRVLDLTDPANPMVIGSYSRYPYVLSVAVEGTIAAVSHGLSGLRIVDVTDPARPVEIGAYDTWGNAGAVALQDQTAYLCMDDAGILIFDLSDPTDPLLVGSYGSDDAHDLIVSGNYAYALIGDSLHILDVSVPQTPQSVGRLGLSPYLLDLALQGNYAYIAAYAYGLRIVDVSDPSLPEEVGAWNPLDNVNRVTVSGSYAYTADAEGDLHILDISDPSTPQELASYDSANFDKLFINGNYLFSTSYYFGFQIHDISNPISPTLAGYYYTYTTEAFDLLAVGNTVYLANGPYFGIYDCSAALPVNPWETTPSQPSSFILHPPHPNPFNASTILSFDLPVAGLVKLEVFDINGRDVGAHCMRPEGLGTRSVPLQAGTHQIPFDGSGLPSGIYLARLTAGDFSAVQKLVLMK